MKGNSVCAFCKSVAGIIIIIITHDKGLYCSQ